MFKKTMLSRSLLLAFSGTAAFASAPAFAQSSTPQELERVTVTGSSIRRLDTETPSPVQIITAEELKASGYTSTQDVLHNLTSNGQGTLSQGFSGAFAEGASGIALRGLTVGATLVLIDGKRAAPYPIGDDGQRSFVDISNIPFDAIERIEVLKDGASAIYGSDAIAGVVNVILKKRYQGASINVDAGVSGHSDGKSYGVSGIWGFGDLAADGRNFYISAEAKKSGVIYNKDRSWMKDFANQDFRFLGGNDLRQGTITYRTSTPTSTTGYITGAGSTTKYFLPGCDNTALVAGNCAINNTWSYIQPPTENYNLVARYTQNLGSEWQASVVASYFERKLTSYGAPATSFTGGYQGNTSGPGVTPTLLAALDPTSLPSTNPAFPQAAKDAGLTAGKLYYSFLNDLGRTVSDNTSKNSRIVLDLDGRLGTWDINASAGYSEIKLDIVDTGNLDPANLQSALDDGSFVPGGANAANVLSFISPTLRRDDSSKLAFFHLGATTELATLAGGPLSLALGTDYYDHKQYAISAPEIMSGAMVGAISDSYTIGEQKVSAVYGELVAPITKQFELDAAARYDHYNISGGKLSPKVGFKFQPVREALFRGTFSKGFRAPNPAENGTAGQTFFAEVIDDPVLCASGDPTATGTFPGQCQITPATIQSTTKTLKPETSTSFTLGLVLEPLKDLTASLDFWSVTIKDQIIAGGPETTVRGTNLAPLQQVQADGSLIDVVPPVAPIAYFTTGYINANQTKVDGVDIDVQYKVKFPSVGDYKTDLNLSYTLDYKLTTADGTFQLAGTHGPFIISGDTGNPRTRIQWSHTLSRDALSITGTINYVGPYDLTDPSIGNLTCADGLYIGAQRGFNGKPADANGVPLGVACKVASFTTFDLYGKYQIAKNFSVHGSVLNLFDRHFPYDWDTYGSTGYTPYNPSLHSAGAIGRFFNIGASYTF